MMVAPLFSAPARRAQRFVQPALSVLSADADVLGELSGSGGRASIHSVFEHAINIDRGPGRLLTLATRASDNAPATLVVDLDGWSELGLVPGSPVILAGGRIVLGGGVDGREACEVLIDTARPWRCELPSYAAADETLSAKVALAGDYLQRFGKGIAAAGAAARAAGAFEKALAEVFQRHRDGLLHALEAGCELRAQEHLHGLLGLGPGLTPAGDDFIVGLLAVFHLRGSPCAGWRRIGAAVLEYAPQQTNVISQAALQHAVNGRVRARLVRLCEALICGEAALLCAALDQVMKIGSTSGCDIASGIVSAFQLNLRMKRVHT